MSPPWLHVLSIISLLTGGACALVIATDEYAHPQSMWIMNWVWPICALFGGLLWLAGYFLYGRKTRSAHKNKPFGISAAEATSHCGSGCTLGDLCAEWLAFLVPSVALWFGWKSVFVEKMFAVWVIDFVFAFLFGIAFQFFTIAPMRKLSLGQGLWAALKADTLSLLAWQLGMYGFMAVAQLWISRTLLGFDLEVNSVEFWFMMQIAMLRGFLSAFPVNWWLLRIGIKEKM